MADTCYVFYSARSSFREGMLRLLPGMAFPPPIYDMERLYDIVEVLVAVGAAHNVSAARVALAWLLHQPGVTSVIAGGRTDEQFADNLAAADLKLGKDDLAKLDEVSRPDLVYPYWHQAWSASDRLNSADMSLIGKYLEK